MITNLIQNNFTPTRQGKSIKYIVLHTYGAPGTNLYNWFNNPQAKASAHYSVEKDGTVRQYVQDVDTAWHSGNWDMNLESIGIEHQDDGQYNNPSTYTEKQYEESSKLVSELCKKYNIPITREFIIPHNQVIVKECPGTLDINKIIKMASSVDNTHEDLWNLLTWYRGTADLTKENFYQDWFVLYGYKEVIAAFAKKDYGLPTDLTPEGVEKFFLENVTKFTKLPF